MKKNKGFTLIELLIVVAIIGLMSAIVLVSLQSARRSANDARRKADLKQMANAAEMYYDTNNAYPWTAAGESCSIGVTGGASCDVACAASPAWTGAGLLITTWLTAPPLDPVNDATRFYCIPAADNDANTFCILAKNLQATTAGYYVAHNGAGTTGANATKCPD